MPAVLTCQCGATLRLPDARTKARIVCPRCQRVVQSQPGEEGIRATPSPARAAPPVSIQEAPPPPAPPPLPKAAPAARDVPVEVAPDAELAEKDRKRSLRAQRRGLKWVNLGLAFHFPAPVIFALATFTACMALGLAAVGHSPRFDGVKPSAEVFGYISAALFVLLTLAEMPSNLLALSFTDPSGRIFFATAFGIRCGACLCAFLVFLFPDYGPGQLFLALILSAGSWAFWMWGLYRVGDAVNRKDIGTGVARTTFSGVKALGLALGGMLVTFVVVFTSVRYPWMLFLFTPAFVASAVKIAFAQGDFDSAWRFFLAPTGIPFVLEYINFILGVRTVIERRV
jgi:hypothetical protein